MLKGKITDFNNIGYWDIGEEFFYNKTVISYLDEVRATVVDTASNSVIMTGLLQEGITNEGSLTLTKSGTGSCIIQANPSGPYSYGTSAKIWANASTGSSFTEALTGTTTPQSFIMNGNKVVKATFTKLPQTITLRPNAIGSTTELSRNGGSANYYRVNETTLDGNSTYVWDNTGGNWDTDTYGTENSADLGTINSDTVYSKCRRYITGSSSASSYSRTAIRVDGSNYFGAVNNMGDSYTNYSTMYTTKPGGGSWTWTDINNLQCGVSLESGDTSGGSQRHA
jgi:hypothetical protein